MRQPVFTIGMLGGACEPGAVEAARLFDRGNEYTIAEVIEAGATIENVIWLLAKRADEDPAALEFMRAWVTRCAREHDAKCKRPMSARQCAGALREAMRTRRRAVGNSRGLKEWTHTVLLQMLEAKGN